LEAARIREVARRAGAEAIRVEDGLLRVEFGEPPTRATLLELVRRSGAVPRFDLSGGVRVEVPLSSRDPLGRLEEVRRVLEMFMRKKS